MSQRHVDPDEILERLEQLEDTQDDHQKRWDATDRWKNHVGDRFEDLEEQVEEQAERIQELEAANAALRDVASEKTTKEEKIAGIVAFAENIAAEEDKDAVTVLPKQITGAVGVSRRYAYDLVDDMTQTYDWAVDPREVDQYGSLEKEAPQKGVLVDFERLHDDPEGVNKFTTGGG